MDLDLEVQRLQQLQQVNNLYLFNRVHGFAEEINFRVLGCKKKYIFGHFFQHVKKLLNFWNFVNIKVGKSKLNHLGFYCILDFLIGQSEKSEIEIEIEY